MSRRDTIAALLAEHGDVVVGQGVTVRAGVRENVRRCVCGLALPWPREEANRAHRAHVADVIDGALDQDEAEGAPGLCDSRGPRVGEDGTRCRLLRGHHGEHSVAPSDGHGDVRWPNDEPRQDEGAPESCGERHPTNPTALACCLDRGHVEDHYSTTECPGSVVRWPRHSHPIDEPRQDEGGDREALARVLYDDAGHHAADHWGVESGITRGRYESAADAVLAWMRAEGFRRHPEVEPVAERIAQAFERAAREVLASPSTRAGDLHPGVVWAGWLRSQAQRVRTEVSDD